MDGQFSGHPNKNEMISYNVTKITWFVFTNGKGHATLDGTRHDEPRLN